MGAFDACGDVRIGLAHAPTAGPCTFTASATAAARDPRGGDSLVRPRDVGVATHPSGAHRSHQGKGHVARVGSRRWLRRGCTRIGCVGDRRGRRPRTPQLVVPLGGRAPRLWPSDLPASRTHTRAHSGEVAAWPLIQCRPTYALASGLGDKGGLVGRHRRALRVEALQHRFGRPGRLCRSFQPHGDLDGAWPSIIQGPAARPCRSCEHKRPPPHTHTPPHRPEARPPCHSAAPTWPQPHEGDLHHTLGWIHAAVGGQRQHSHLRLRRKDSRARRSKGRRRLRGPSPQVDSSAGAATDGSPHLAGCAHGRPGAFRAAGNGDGQRQRRRLG